MTDRKKELTIIYLLNSGFLVRGDGWALLFDDFQDPAGAVDQALPEIEELYIFASHAHFDHFSPEIARYAKKTRRYFLSRDIAGVPSARRIPADQTTWLGVYDSYEGDRIRVVSYDSTDEGTSFAVTFEGWRIFHAGDFNWWHWREDTLDNIGFARNGFMKQMKKLDGTFFDLAFFPADGRLEEARSWGAKEFCRRTDTRALVTMHSVGYPRWRPEPDFFLPGREIPYWSPVTPGEKRHLAQGGKFTE